MKMKWNSLVALSVMIFSCRGPDRGVVQELRKQRSINIELLAEIHFIKDTIGVYPPSFFITGKNISDIPLNIIAVVPSCTCERVYIKSTTVLPGDSVRFSIQAKMPFAIGAITIIGNLENGQKTIFLKAVSK